MSQFNPRVYLSFYCMVFMGVGLFANSLGPLIPYLAKERKVLETEYSSLFMAVAVGNLLGILGYQMICRLKIRNLEHKILIFVGIVYAICMNLFMIWENKIGEFFCMTCFGFGYYFFDTALNICLLLICGKSGGSWIPFAHAFYGVGALLSPLIVRLFETQTYFVYSFLYITISCLSFYF